MEFRCPHEALNSFQLLSIGSQDEENTKIGLTLLEETTKKLLEQTSYLPCIECLKSIESIIKDFNNINQQNNEILRNHESLKNIGKIIERLLSCPNITLEYSMISFSLIAQLFYLSDILWLNGRYNFLKLLSSLCEVKLRVILGDYKNICTNHVNDICDIVEGIIKEIEKGNLNDTIATDLSFSIQKCILFLCEWIYAIHKQNAIIIEDVEVRVYSLIIYFLYIGGGEILDKTNLKYALTPLQMISLRYIKKDYAKARSLICVISCCPVLPDSTLEYLLNFTKEGIKLNHKEVIKDLCSILDDFKDRCDYYDVKSLQELKKYAKSLNDCQLQEIVNSM
uniref:WAPL domain-containing protein n=1 Tax=Parastrongyloides trichosuri TaxID=131310 RepID=A0A0N4ZMK3_PARTI